mmetsp:Transcript_6182/g.10328  ORF Transcript_6182/g.10328 Transcript_6182/m.10328 type:complete len:517 (+) Transcript_6182:252-1802(+)
MSAANPLFESVVWIYTTANELKYDDLVDLIIHAPQYYSTWWKMLLKEAPLHLVIETGLLLFIIWLLFIRRTVDPVKAAKNERLSKKEEDWLLETWEPEPLASTKLTKKEQALSSGMKVIESVDDNYLTIRGVPGPVLNVASFDFLGMSLEPSIKDVAKDALDYYGCGSCGPRGFYGTIDQHLIFEQKIAEFMGTEEAISYSDGASTVSSAIPAFSKKGDLLLVDEAVSESILAGCNLSRSTVQFFKHNDMDDLRTILESIAADDKRLRRDAQQQRRFIVVEGLYRTTGDVCPLPQLIELKEKFFYRLILDESLSFGAIGATGRGVTEYFGMSIKQVEIALLAMDTALASVGGVCIGNRDIVDHQRLSGAGYCFSASAPPFLSATAVKALALMEAEPQRLEVLHANARAMHAMLSQLKGLQLKTSNIITPVFHLQLCPRADSLQEEELLIMKLAEVCVMNGVGATACKFALAPKSKYPGANCGRPSLTLNASTKLTSKEIAKIGIVIANALRVVMEQ